MKCNCIEDLEKGLSEKYKDNYIFEKIDGELKVQALNIAFTFDAEGTHPYMPFRISKEYKTKSGKDRTRKEDVNVMFTYCPFCGRKLEK